MLKFKDIWQTCGISLASHFIIIFTLVNAPWPSAGLDQTDLNPKQLHPMYHHLYLALSPLPSISGSMSDVDSQSQESKGSGICGLLSTSSISILLQDCGQYM